MEDESSAIGQLGSLALGNLLQEIGIDSEVGVDRVGLGPKPSALDKDAIYNERYEDDEDDELARMQAGPDEDELRRAAEEKALQERYLAKGLASIRSNGSRTAVRGETDDFDDDDDEDERPLPPRPVSQSPPPPTSPPPTHSVVKQEPMDDDDHNRSLFSLPVGGGVTLPGATASTSYSDDQPALRLPTPPPRRDVKEFWPDFDPDKVLDFTDFFAAPRRKKRRVAPSKQIQMRPSGQHLEPPTSTRDLVKSSAPVKAERPDGSYIERIAGDILQEEAKQSKVRLGQVGQAGYELQKDWMHLPELDDWENRVMLHPNSLPAMPTNTDVQRPVNHNLHADHWLESIIWSTRQARDPRKIELNSRLVLDLNDEEMMIEQVAPGTADQQSLSLVSSSAPVLSRRAAQAAASLDPLNMSNDGFYELTREQRQRIQRQTLGALVVQHTKVARKLQLPFYKTRLSKQEARSFHRPAMQFPINIPLSFSRVQKAGVSGNNAAAKKDRKRNKDADEVLKSTRDLTLKEQGSFVLYEYSEEHPPIPMKIGMGSILVNYYRKKDAKDEYIPKLDLGEPFILEPNDESPFLKFGSVEPGETQSTLYNNLVRAPLFRHQPATTDFLLVRVTSKNSVRYYLRDIKNLFVVGQNYPLAVIPGPHARLVTNAIRNRLIMICRRLVEQSKGNRIKIHRIIKYFPDQTELQMRQRLKEFMEYARKAGDPNQGFWRLRSTVNLPSDAELEKLLPPEHMCLVEAMQAGQRHLLDAGYERTADGADEDEDKESGLDIEQLLAPWTTSKNFIMATQGKAMLRLHGPGDPTGRGEAFSFVRVSMKDVFYKAGEDQQSRVAQQAEEERRSGHKYNVARQQQIYREEIQRIWDAQRQSLSSAQDLELTPEEANPPSTPQEAEEGDAEADQEDADADADGEIDPDADADADGEPDGEAPAPAPAKPTKPVNPTKAAIAAGKILQIRRQINGRWQTETVRDPKVIQAYVSARQRIADEATTTEALVPTGDAALDAARRKRLEEEIASRMKNQERRLARRNAKAVAEGKVLPNAYQKLMADKPTTSRRCGRCGQVGHMSSNRSCPLWGQVPAAAAPGSVSSVSGSRGIGEEGGASGSGAGEMGPPAQPQFGGAMMGPGASYFPGVPSMPGTPMGGMSRNPSFKGAGQQTASSPPASSGGGGSSGGGPSKPKLKFKIKSKPKQ